MHCNSNSLHVFIGIPMLICPFFMNVPMKLTISRTGAVANTGGISSERISLIFAIYSISGKHSRRFFKLTMVPNKFRFLKQPFRYCVVMEIIHIQYQPYDNFLWKDSCRLCYMIPIIEMNLDLNPSRSIFCKVLTVFVLTFFWVLMMTMRVCLE